MNCDRYSVKVWKESEKDVTKRGENTSLRRAAEGHECVHEVTVRPQAIHCCHFHCPDQGFWTSRILGPDPQSLLLKSLLSLTVNILDWIVNNYYTKHNLSVSV